MAGNPPSRRASGPQVDRKQVPADWSRKLQAVQAKAAALLKELPPGFLGQFEGERAQRSVRSRGRWGAAAVAKVLLLPLEPEALLLHAQRPC